MGVLPLQFLPGESATSLGLNGTETLSIEGLSARYASGNPVAGQLTVKVTGTDGASSEFKVDVRVDTPAEAEYFRHGGILQYVLRRLAAGQQVEATS
jgi:aconitate hydratase